MNCSTLNQLAKSQVEWTTAVRRALHEIPEPSGKEFKSQAFIMEKLAELGIPCAPMLTGVVGLIEGVQPGKTIALRADMDALPVTEPDGLPFRSLNDGWMHACGHDVHSAVLLGTAKLLSENRGQWAGNVKLIFQPAEECTSGARQMIELGVMENPRVDFAYGLHVMPHLPAGTIETRAGTFFATADVVKIDITGQGCHGAYPDFGADAIVCAAQVVTALQTVVSRNAPPAQAAVLSIGVIEGGTAHNIICDRVALRGTLRTANAALRERLFERIHEVATGVATAMGCEARVDLNDSCPAVVNGEEGAQRVLALGNRLLGDGKSVIRESPSMGAEDFAYFLERAPGAYYNIGCADPEGTIPAPALHSRAFYVDERCIPVGIAMQAGLVIGPEDVV